MFLAGIALQALRADTITFPQTATDETAFPFGDLLVTSYQQLYDFSSLSGAITISELDFTIDPSTVQPGADIAAESYYVTLSPQSPPSTPGQSILASTIQSDVGAAAPAAANSVLELASDNTTLRLILNTPESYDPTQGTDLLLDLEQVSFDPASPQFPFALLASSALSSAVVDTATCSSGCVYDLLNPDPGNPSSNLPQIGLATTFIETPNQTSVPEPATLGMLVAGLGLLGIVGRRRHRARA